MNVKSSDSSWRESVSDNNFRSIDTIDIFGFENFVSTFGHGDLFFAPKSVALSLYVTD